MLNFPSKLKIVAENSENQKKNSEALKLRFIIPKDSKFV